MNRAAQAVPAITLAVVGHDHDSGAIRFVGLKLAHRQKCLVPGGAVLLMQIPGDSFGSTPALPGTDLQDAKRLVVHDS